MAKKYSIGVDFGSLSGRAVLVNVADGSEAAVAVYEYPHAVMDEFIDLGDSRVKLGHGWALQHPQDYLDVLENTVPEILKKAGASPRDVIGLGIDFTACTMLPVNEKLIPLCFDEKFRANPHSYVKLWKHHAAQDEADRLNETAGRLGETFLSRYGGKISSEWFFPKVMQILNEAPEIYAEAYRFMEAADWVISTLIGKESRNSCTAGYKSLWSKRGGYPPKEFFKALDPRLENVVEEKMGTLVSPIGSRAGGLTAEFAEKLGLDASVAVAVANVDAHVALPAIGISDAGKMLMIMGTSTCHIMLGNEEKMVPGMCGVVEDGVLPGYFGYEAGQSCVGDHFEWFIENCLPSSYCNEAKNEGVADVFKWLTDKAARLKPGQSGLVALDWWNGNRSVLVDANLTGLILGLTLQTKPEEIYRALIEATAFGTRMITETFNSSGVPVNKLYAAGGIAEKNSLMMQIYADVTNMTIAISPSPQLPALGSAMFGAVAAGSERGGYDSIQDAQKSMSGLIKKTYSPIPENVKIYNFLFEEYRKLHDSFGRGGIMKNLLAIKIKACGDL